MHVSLVYDWIGPDGPWPNDQSLSFHVSKNRYVHSDYATMNLENPYNFEGYRTAYTLPKLPILLDRIGANYDTCSTSDVIGAPSPNMIYELTPLLKPHQWTHRVFDNMSDAAMTLHRGGDMHIIINDINEGYGTRLYNMAIDLHQQANIHNLDVSKITYLTSNTCMDHYYDEWCGEYRVNDRMNIECILVFEIPYSGMKNPIDQPRDFKYTYLIRRPDNHRIALLYAMYVAGLFKYGQISCPNIDHLDSDIILGPYGMNGDKWEEFVALFPQKVDDFDINTQICDDRSNGAIYENADFHIVTEQDIMDPTCIKFTEKTFIGISRGSSPIFWYPDGAVTAFTGLGYISDVVEYSTSNLKDKLAMVVAEIKSKCETPPNYQTRLHNTSHLIDRYRMNNNRLTKLLGETENK